MTIAPKEPKDLALAPVAAAIDMNLRRLRDEPLAQIDYELTLELNTPLTANEPAERAERVLRVAMRDVDMHHWSARITDDLSSVRLYGGSVSIDLGLGASVRSYIVDGVPAESARG